MKLIRDVIQALTFKRPGLSSRVQGTNSTVITDTTVRTILAAPATGYTNYIQSITLSNPTTAEVPCIAIKDGSTLLFHVQLDAGVTTGAATQSATRQLNFDPPLAVSGILGGNSLSAVGDVTATAIGFTALTTEAGNS